MDLGLEGPRHLRPPPQPAQGVSKCVRNAAQWGPAGAFREVPELTGAARGPGPPHAWALTHCPALAGRPDSLGPRPPACTPTPAPACSPSDSRPMGSQQPALLAGPVGVHAGSESP